MYVMQVNLIEVDVDDVCDVGEVDVDHVGDEKDTVRDVGNVDDICDVDEVDVDDVGDVKDVGDVIQIK